MSKPFSRRPTVQEIAAAAREVGLSLSESDCQSFIGLLEGCVEAYETVGTLVHTRASPKYSRSLVRRPDETEDPLNAWVVKTDISGAAAGKLANRRIAVKDNICVAGVPLENGSDLLRGFVPDVDATVVTRLLEAGGRIVGKTRCESFCASCASFTGAGGPVHNPHRRGYSAGGSSSGSAAAVAAGEVEMALGSDQGGSIRVPAALCGIVGLKPTYGLVPYTGIIPTELTLDHTGPMTATVADNALMLEVLAGPDGLDPRQRISAHVSYDYTQALNRSVEGMRIGMVVEGFDIAGIDPSVAEQVRRSAVLLRDLGATVENVSIPSHAIGAKIWLPIILEGSIDLMFTGNGFGRNWAGPFVTAYTERHAHWKEGANTLPEVLKVLLVGARWFAGTSQGCYYGMAQNAARTLRAAYDAALLNYDLLLMPTVPKLASEHPPVDSTRELQFLRAVEGTPNAAPFDVTGHPAISIPCGKIEELPVGLMLIGKHFGEHDIYRAAHAFERARVG